MIIENLKQGTKEWIAWRHEGIGGSDVSVIMEGETKYKTITQLIYEKIDPNPPKQMKKAIFTAGHKYEDEIRPIIAMTQFIECEPVLFQDDELPFMRVSLDGYDPKRKIVWECKLTGKDNYFTVKLKNLSPDCFNWQIQYQLMVSGCKEARLTAGRMHVGFRYNLNDSATCVVEANKDCQKLIREKVSRFWEEVCVRKNKK